MLVSSGANAADTIKIAVAVPLTGTLTQYGGMVKQGVDTEIEAINAAGGVLGKKLEAVTMDDACEPKQAPVVANRVVNDNIHYVVGHRSEEHTSELQSLMRISYAVFCLKKQT